MGNKGDSSDTCGCWCLTGWSEFFLETADLLGFTKAHQKTGDVSDQATFFQSQFLLPGRVRIWCNKYDTVNPSCLVPTLQDGAGGVGNIFFTL